MNREEYNLKFKQLTFSIHSRYYYLLTELSNRTQRIQGGYCGENKIAAIILEKWLKALEKKISKENPELDSLVKSIWHDV